MQWERISVEQNTSRWRRDVVWLSKTSAPARRYSKLNISRNLCNEAGLKVGDSIWLYKSGTTFLIKKEPSDFYLRTNTGIKSNHETSLSLTNMNLVAKITGTLAASGYKEIPTTFDAIVTEEGIVFEPRKEE